MMALRVAAAEAESSVRKYRNSVDNPLQYIVVATALLHNCRAKLDSKSIMRAEINHPLLNCEH